MPASKSAPATRADLAAVRDDLTVVKDDLAVAKSELKADITASTRRLALEIIGTNARVDRLETSLREEVARSTDRIMNAIDDFAKKSMDAGHAFVLHGRAITEIQVKLKDYGRRLNALEGPVHDAG